jgi:hypothetical protein
VEPEPSHLERAPTGRLRSRIVAFAVVAMAVQLLAPASYYLRHDPYDERFAWRMFSSVRLHTCATTAVETVGGATREVPLAETIHQAWITNLRRNRRDVAVRLLEKRCDEPGVARVEVRNVCRSTSGAALPPQVYALDCATGVLSLPAWLQVTR